jgi:hypothetical protein
MLMFHNVCWTAPNNDKQKVHFHLLKLTGLSELHLLRLDSFLPKIIDLFVEN